ncbi:MAG TPA: hypothetical protein VH306_07900 [Gaiellaceae bacterium]
MRRLASALIVAVVGVIAAFAVADAVRGDRSHDRAAASPGTVELRTSDARTTFGGTLLWTDARCGFHATSLPSLQDLEPPRYISCKFTLERDGHLAPPGGTWRAEGNLLARCRHDRIDVSLNLGGPPLYETQGCAPAWRPDGTLTYVFRGELRRSSRLWDRRVLLDRAQLSAAIHWPSRLERVAWLDNSTFVALVKTRDRRYLATFHDGRPVRPAIRLTAPVQDLAASPHGNYIAARVDGGLVVLRRDGSALALPFLNALAIAWSPDERWAIVSGRRSAYLFRPGDQELRVRRLPIAATQLAWVQS